MIFVLYWKRLLYFDVVDLCTKVYQLTGAHLEPVSHAVPLVCGSTMLSYSLCHACHLRYKAEGKTARMSSVRQRDSNLEEREKKSTIAKLLLAAPDLMGGADLSFEQGELLL